MTTPPLAGLLVLDFTRHLSGPFATMLLHDLGAEVIKFESRSGDPARRAGPFADGDSAYFQPINRGKRSIVVDLTAPSDVAAILRLVPFADCLAENFRPGVMTAAGLGADAVRAVNPSLVYASCSGFGATGPLSDRPAFDVVVQAMGGIMSVTGTPDSGPTRVGVSQADIVGGVFLALAICAALARRERTGAGAVVDLSMYEAQLMLLTHALGITCATGSAPPRIGNRHPAVAPFDVFPVADGDVAVAAADARSFGALCEALEVSELATDPRFASNDLRLANIGALTDAIAARTRPLTKAQLTDRLTRAQVPCGAVATLTDVLADAHLAARRALLTLLPFGDLPQGLAVPALPFLLDGERLADPSPAPPLGEQTLAELESELTRRDLAND
jgi:CoA:oxalate CoA-transferase